MYKLNLSVLGGEPCSVNKTNEDGSFVSIPFDTANTYYQAYLKWLDEGGVPMPADDPASEA